MFKDMNDEDLRTAYQAWRCQMVQWDDMAKASRFGKGSARGFGRALRNVEIIEAIARRRGISLRAVAK